MMDIRAKQLISEGRRVINLSAGEPDFRTPQCISDAGIRAITEGDTKYTPASGCKELKQGIADLYGCTSSEVCISSGAKLMVYTAVNALCDPGDEILIPSPYWTSYFYIAGLSGAVPVPVPCGSDFRMTAACLESCITPRTKLLLINNPVNPTGVVYSENEIREFCSVCEKHDIYIISDEIYSSLVYDVPFVSFRDFAPERTVMINGLSKSFAMTGWRIGYSVSPSSVSSVISSLLSQSAGAPCTISQIAGTEALLHPEETERMRLEYSRRRDVLLKTLGDLVAVRPEGAFYLLLDFRNKGNSDTAADILEKTGVALVDCTEFGAPGFLRLSYVRPVAVLEEAALLINQYVSCL